MIMSENLKFSDLEIKEARTRLWFLGNLVWKLDPAQKNIYDFVYSNSQKTTVVNCSRRIGKSYLLTIIAIEQCIKKPKSIVKFLQPEQKMVRVNIRPIMDRILEDCPQELRPTFKTQDNIYVFPNGSEIQLAGTDNGNHEKLRGGDADLCLVDEAAFVQGELQYIVRSILLPSTMLTRGKIILSSSSPKDPNHEFAKYMELAESQGGLIRLTLFDALKIHKKMANPRFTDEIVQEIINEYPGKESSDDFRRECLCITLVDGDNAVFPEVTEDLLKDIVKEWPRPAFCSRYVAMDIGFKDLTVVLFAFYDFENAVTVIEDELVINGPKMTTPYLAEEINKIEKRLWTDKLTGEFTKPYLRVSDNNLIVINDLQKLHGLTFLPTAKDNRDAAVNNARIELGGYQVYINPKCKTLIYHVKNAIWDNSRKDFARSADAGHYDAAAAIIYLLRNIDKNRNPFPPGYRFRNSDRQNMFFGAKNQSNDQEHSAFANLFKPRKSLKN